MTERHFIYHGRPPTLSEDIQMLDPDISFWKAKKVLVTGGASFIGSHLVDSLVSLGSKVTVVDNLSSGTVDNLEKSLPEIRFVKEDLEYSSLDRLVGLFKGSEIVFHLAATHGGRGYINSHPADITSNFAIDHHVFEACATAGAGKVVFASTACVYPPVLQSKVGSNYLLKEEDAPVKRLDGPLSSDLEYGWAKLMGEMQLNSFIQQYGMKGCSVRFVTAYGPRENETHAIVALIYKAFEQMDPYVIWGDGSQERDFTYVSDIVSGSLLAAEKISDGTPVNLGTEQRISLFECARMIFDLMEFHPKIKFDPAGPVGVLSRALDISRARTLLGWEPRVSLSEGLSRTIDWYVKTHKPNGGVVEKLLYERTQQIAGT
jgi:nucleoside-diphosphate-sugar epimerase